MAYDEKLAGQIRAALGRWRGVTEKKMFGGLAFLLNGKMFCGIQGEELMLRLGAEGGLRALERAHVRPMDFTGRPMRGYVYVGAQGVKSAAALARWVEQAASFVSKLAKTPAPVSRRSPARRGQR